LIWEKKIKFKSKSGMRKAGELLIALSIVWFSFCVDEGGGGAVERWYLRPEFNHTFDSIVSVRDFVVSSDARRLLISSDSTVYCVLRDNQGFVDSATPFLFSPLFGSSVRVQWHPIISTLYYAVVYTGSCEIYLMNISSLSCDATIVQNFAQSTIVFPFGSCQLFVSSDATNLYTTQTSSLADALFSYQLDPTGIILDTPDGLGVYVIGNTFYGGIIKTSYPNRAFISRYGTSINTGFYRVDLSSTGSITTSTLTLVFSANLWSLTSNQRQIATVEQSTGALQQYWLMDYNHLTDVLVTSQVFSFPSAAASKSSISC